MAIDFTYPIFGLHFRRYAPFERFGQFNPLAPGTGYFEGDNRGASTSLQVSSRTYGAIFFSKVGIVYEIYGSSGTTYHPGIGDPISGTAAIKHTLVRSTAQGADGFGFTASTAGSNPLVPFSPDIDTLMEATVEFGGQSELHLKGTVFGDNFPNLEVFLRCYKSGNNALLVDGRTEGGRQTGPMGHLWGVSANQIIGYFDSRLSLDSNGWLQASSTCPASDMG